VAASIAQTVLELMAGEVAAVSPPPGGLRFDPGVEKQASSRQPRNLYTMTEGKRNHPGEFPGELSGDDGTAR